MRSRRSGLLAALVLTLVASSARADSVDELLAQTPEEIRTALAGVRGTDARNALHTVLTAGKVDRGALAGAMANPRFAPHVVDTLIDLAVVHDVPGVNEVLVRIAQAHDEAGPRGASFEISVGARLRPRLAALSTMVDGHEVDAVLTDGTVVETKYVEGRRSGRLVRKAIDQLKLRGAGGKRPVMLVINRELHPDQLATIGQELGPTAQVLQASRTGLLRVQRQSKVVPLAAGRVVRDCGGACKTIVRPRPILRPPTTITPKYRRAAGF